MKHLTQLVFKDVTINAAGDTASITVQKRATDIMVWIHDCSTSRAYQWDTASTRSGLLDNMQFEPHILFKIVDDAIDVLTE